MRRPPLVAMVDRRLRRRAASVVVLVAQALALSGCGDDGSGDREPARAGIVDVEVRVDPDGPGARPAVRRSVRCGAEDDRARCRVLRDAPADTWTPVPRRQACTQIYGGPQTARVTGVVGGRRVDARFSRRNGCELSRWQTIAGVLDPLARG